MDEAASAGNARHSRFWLYTPFVLLLLLAVAWSVGWFVIRNRADEALDTWLAAEARAGRQWTCQDRAIGGYPFRIEVTCDALTLQQGAVTASFGPVEAVAQVYQPRRVITEIQGPLRVTDGTVTVQGSWDLLQTSLNLAPGGLRRLSLVAEAPNVTVTGLPAGEIAAAGQHLELHARPNPSRSAENAYDVALSVRQARIPLADALVGGTEATDLESDVTVTQAEGFRGRPLAEELERWRSAGGKLDVLMLSLAKGSRRLEAKGELRLDEEHRPEGQLALSAAGLDGLLGNVMGRRNGALLSALLGQGGGAPAGQANGRPALSPLPPVRLDNGRLAFGPFVIPNVTLPAIY
ncbi:MULTISPECIES: DUF2125 domain-containing protein [Microvirga]|uniref:DUF2125 domain-containing protein n=1 Tax=Microvirga TaxID=186650 RepID=UPI001CFDF4AE|nr:DUF2125 domain-containing protein [Microvirga lenta]MCB5174389.1 DUF2125 domain-containing protein [Microvirga lenta]